MSNLDKLRKNVAEEYRIALYRRYREKEAVGIVGYEAAWWKRHRKAGNIPFIRDAGGGIGYLGYMLCDIIILGKDAKRGGGESGGMGGSTPPVSGPDDNTNSGGGGASVAADILSGK